MSHSLPASTLSELLIVIIVSGIIFLMIFEGWSMLRQYSSLVTRRLMQKSQLIESHLVMGALMAESDSIQQRDYELLFYTNAADTVKTRLTIDSTHIMLYKGNRVEQLFPGLISFRQTSLIGDPLLIDSIVITTKCAEDTLLFEYGLSF